MSRITTATTTINTGRLARRAAFGSVAVLVLGLSACGSDGSTSQAATPAVAATAAPAAAPAGKVSANDASKGELVSAMETAGIANADKWADELIEYRPYSADDGSWERVAGELEKYNASPETIDQILSLLDL